MIEVSHTCYKKQLSRSKGRFISIHTSLITHWMKNLDIYKLSVKFWVSI